MAIDDLTHEILTDPTLRINSILVFAADLTPRSGLPHYRIGSPNMNICPGVSVGGVKPRRNPETA